MMPNRILIDSHILVWMLYEQNRLGIEAQELLKVCETIFISDATLIELVFKYGSGKFPYSPETLLRGIEDLQLQILPIRRNHLLEYPDVKLSHKDPFDTLLIAQSVSEGAPLVTADSKLLASRYETIDARAC